MKDLTKAENVLAHMLQANSANDWNRRCDDVKRANGGNYPGFWFHLMILSGIAQAIRDSWQSK